MKMVKKFYTPLKIVFFLVIVGVVIHSILGIAKDVSGTQFKQGLSMISLKEVVLLAIVGFVSVLPMLTYDFILVRILNIKKSKYDIASVGLFVNTLNNLLGFGGLIGIGLRYRFYKNETKSKTDIQYGLAKLAIFLMSGLSISSWLALIILISLHDFNFTWIVSLVIAGSYTPIVLVYTKFSKNQNMNDLSINNKLLLLLGSVLEWLGCSATFISIGSVLGFVHQPLLAFSVFIVANVLGIVSMIPGGIGMFESVIIFGLQPEHISINLILIWLLLYRMFYYVLPILVGTILIAMNKITCLFINTNDKESSHV